MSYEGIQSTCWGLGAISMSVRHFGVCQYIRHSQSVVCLLLDGILGCLMLHAVVLFFVVFIMSKSLLPWL